MRISENNIDTVYIANCNLHGYNGILYGETLVEAVKEVTEFGCMGEFLSEEDIVKSLEKIRCKVEDVFTKYKLGDYVKELEYDGFGYIIGYEIDKNVNDNSLLYVFQSIDSDVYFFGADDLEKIEKKDYMLQLVLKNIETFHVNDPMAKLMCDQFNFVGVLPQAEWDETDCVYRFTGLYVGSDDPNKWCNINDEFAVYINALSPNDLYRYNTTNNGGRL